MIILRDVEFFDGTTCENALYGPLCEKYEQKMLEAGDENILPRACSSDCAVRSLPPKK